MDKSVIDKLHELKCSCVVENHGQTRVFWQRGVDDLLALLTDAPDFLAGASIADKVVGKGAAAIMVLGAVKEVYADKISTPALELLRTNDIPTAYGEEIDHVQNRTNTDWCPLEKICYPLTAPIEMLRAIAAFKNIKSPI